MSQGNNSYSHLSEYQTAFKVGIFLNLSFVIIEVIYGFISNSLSLLADAGHNLGDVMGLALAWGAYYLSQKPPTIFRTYGYKRTSILAAFLNALILFVTVGAIALESIRRLNSPEQSNGYTIIIVSIIGVLINSVSAVFFISGIKKDLNIKGAFIHMASDAAVSLGVVIAGILILYTGYQVLDPIVGLIIACVIIFSTFGLLRDSFNMATDAVPSGIDYNSVKDFLLGYNGVKALHDLHIWNLSTTDIALTVHLVRTDDKLEEKYISDLSKQLKEKFFICHSTIQIENENAVKQCELSSDKVI